MGGHTDILGVDRCRVIDIDIPIKTIEPLLGMSGWKKRLNAENRPLFGAIIKPKSGLNKEQLLSLVKDMMYGGGGSQCFILVTFAQGKRRAHAVLIRRCGAGRREDGRRVDTRGLRRPRGATWRGGDGGRLLYSHSYFCDPGFGDDGCRWRI